MKFILCIAAIIISSQTYSQENQKLLGPTSKKVLADANNYMWYQKEYDAYKIDESYLPTNKGDINIKIFFGSWCGDSQREVPRFIKVLKDSGFKTSQYELIAVDNTIESYKQSPSGEEKGLNIYRVPSFLVYRGENLIGRIIESPVNTLEQDLYQIISGKNDYSPRYSFTLDLDNKLEQNHKYLSKTLKSTDRTPRLESQSEMLSYALSKWSNQEYDKAITALKFNLKVFPDYQYAHKYLGYIYRDMGKEKLAFKHFKTYHQLNPEDAAIKDLLANRDN
ncbi:hypothetical protein E1176_13485 [Fulvivirga sp. RKSG066]|uniref:hypothetical protein n=1 Tax=Fulvivirga aurantia TaxID=2529383 RepID=UPI0012BD78B1|nr:hypothetical protein [Fulvivirga aurantia]MTI22037.1 hypothetical protein [Fulvivirga aurantia]